MLGGSLGTWVRGLPFFSFIFVMYSNKWYVISPFPLYFSIIGQTKLSEIGISFISFENGKYSSSSAISYNPVDWATWSPTSLAIILVKPFVVWAYFIRRLFQSGFTITLFLMFPLQYTIIGSWHSQTATIFPDRASSMLHSVFTGFILPIFPWILNFCTQRCILYLWHL